MSFILPTHYNNLSSIESWSQTIFMLSSFIRKFLFFSIPTDVFGSSLFRVTVSPQDETNAPLWEVKIRLASSRDERGHCLQMRELMRLLSQNKRGLWLETRVVIVSRREMQLSRDEGGHCLEMRQVIVSRRYRSLSWDERDHCIEMPCLLMSRAHTWY